MKPNLFLVGAPKCGTTSLASWLGEHPGCFLPEIKEPHFFSDFLDRGMSLEDYEKLYAAAGPGVLCRLDASTSYLSSPSAIPKILDYSESAIFLVMLRNPVELVQSLHAQVLFVGAEDEPDFGRAWQLQHQRRQGKRLPTSCENPRMLQYREQALLGESLARVCKLAGENRVHWTYLEDLALSPRDEYQRVLRFCRLEDDGRTNFPVFNRSKSHSYPRINRALRRAGHLRARTGLPGLGVRKTLTRLAGQASDRRRLSRDLRRQLYHEFSSDIRLLERITNRDLAHWNPDFVA